MDIYAFSNRELSRGGMRIRDILNIIGARVLVFLVTSTMSFLLLFIFVSAIVVFTPASSSLPFSLHVVTVALAAESFLIIIIFLYLKKKKKDTHSSYDELTQYRTRLELESRKALRTIEKLSLEKNILIDELYRTEDKDSALIVENLLENIELRRQFLVDFALKLQSVIAVTNILLLQMGMQSIIAKNPVLQSKEITAIIARIEEWKITVTTGDPEMDDVLRKIRKSMEIAPLVSEIESILEEKQLPTDDEAIKDILDSFLSNDSGKSK